MLSANIGTHEFNLLGDELGHTLLEGLRLGGVGPGEARDRGSL